jgi:thiamine biosynthesis protein ThiS
MAGRPSCDESYCPPNPIEARSVEKTLRVQVNGEGRELGDRTTLSDLVAELSLAPARIAVELNHQVVRRDKWSETILFEDDRIEIVHFVGGGL